MVDPIIPSTSPSSDDPSQGNIPQGAPQPSQSPPPPFSLGHHKQPLRSQITRKTSTQKEEEEKNPQIEEQKESRRPPATPTSGRQQESEESASMQPSAPTKERASHSQEPLVNRPSADDLLFLRKERPPSAQELLTLRSSTPATANELRALRKQAPLTPAEWLSLKKYAPLVTTSEPFQENQVPTDKELLLLKKGTPLTADELSTLRSGKPLTGSELLSLRKETPLSNQELLELQNFRKLTEKEMEQIKGTPQPSSKSLSTPHPQSGRNVSQEEMLIKKASEPPIEQLQPTPPTSEPLSEKKARLQSAFELPRSQVKQLKTQELETSNTAEKTAIKKPGEALSEEEKARLQSALELSKAQLEPLKPQEELSPSKATEQIKATEKTATKKPGEDLSEEEKARLQSTLELSKAQLEQLKPQEELSSSKATEQIKTTEKTATKKPSEALSEEEKELQLIGKAQAQRTFELSSKQAEASRVPKEEPKSTTPLQRSKIQEETLIKSAFEIASEQLKKEKSQVESIPRTLGAPSENKPTPIEKQKEKDLSDKISALNQPIPALQVEAPITATPSAPSPPTLVSYEQFVSIVSSVYQRSTPLEGTQTMVNLRDGTNISITNQSGRLSITVASPDVRVQNIISTNASAIREALNAKQIDLVELRVENLTDERKRGLFERPAQEEDSSASDEY